MARWQGPYEVVDRVGEVNYRVRQPGRRKPTQLYHINLLKQWRTGTAPPLPAPQGLAARRHIPGVPVGDDLSPAQKQDRIEVILQHQGASFSCFCVYVSLVGSDVQVPVNLRDLARYCGPNIHSL